MIFASATKVFSRADALTRRLFSFTPRTCVVVPLFLEAAKRGDSVALATKVGTLTYSQLYSRALKLAKRIASKHASTELGSGSTTLLDTLQNQRVGTLCDRQNFIVATFAVWMLGGCIVPIDSLRGQKQSLASLTDLVLADENHKSGTASLPVALQSKLLFLDEDTSGESSEECAYHRTLFEEAVQKDFYSMKPAVLWLQNHLSNGVSIMTHGSMHANVQAAAKAWRITQRDLVLSTLDQMNAITILNALFTPLYAGACVLEPHNYESNELWQTLVDPHPYLPQRHVTVFFNQAKLIRRMIKDSFWSANATHRSSKEPKATPESDSENSSDASYDSSKSNSATESREEFTSEDLAEEKTDVHEEEHAKRLYSLSADAHLASLLIRASCSRVRLMFSSSVVSRSEAARWYSMTGHKLLVNYVRNETGLVITQPVVSGSSQGSKVVASESGAMIGVPLENMQVRIVDRLGKVVAEADGSTIRTLSSGRLEGKLLVRGPSEFGSYLEHTEQTHKAFAPGRWFRTGDTASVTLGKEGQPTAIKISARSKTGPRR